MSELLSERDWEWLSELVRVNECEWLWASERLSDGKLDWEWVNVSEWAREWVRMSDSE